MAAAISKDPVTVMISSIWSIDSPRAGMMGLKYQSGYLFPRALDQLSYGAFANWWERCVGRSHHQCLPRAAR